MNKKEFSQLSIGLKASYPRFQMLVTDDEMSFWYTMLQDIDYKVAQNAVLEYISTSIFPPSIAEIRKLCMERCKRSALSFDEAWGIVQKAIATYGRDRPREAFETMDELTLTVVKNLGWRNLCMSENQVADRANFREIYEVKARALQASDQLPEFVMEGKALLIEQYASEIKAARPVPQIEKKEEGWDLRDSLTPEQLEERAKRFEETRKRILGEKT